MHSKIIMALLLFNTSVFAQQLISGQIKNREGTTIVGANITLSGTIEGATSGSEGRFSFQTDRSDSITIEVSYTGYERFVKRGPVTAFSNMVVVLQEAGKNLDEVVINMSSFSLGKTQGLKQMNALDIVMTGSSNGDIYRALQSLPGTQIVGEDGKLYVRGGAERETQTFIDGMHVLVPYTSTAQDMPSRGRFSPFLFKGINFSTGGYESEYGQALSAVLPMDTKDVASENKLGVNVSPLSVGGGGTTVLGKKSSLSANLDYTNLSLYNELFKDKYQWQKNYSKLSAEMQYKAEVGKKGLFKLYGAFEKTGFIRRIDDTLNHVPTRQFELDQNNYYLNSTYKTRTANNINLFFGGAVSYADNKYGNASFQGDRYRETMSEIHLKFRTSKYITSGYKATFGLENYDNSAGNTYIDTLERPVQQQQFSNQIIAAFLDNQLRIANHLFGNASGRVEYSAFNEKLVFSPRLSLSFIQHGLQLSVIYGRYSQLPETKYLLAVHQDLAQERATHYIFGTSYQVKGIFFKAEAYLKDYSQLSWLNQESYRSEGFGKSKGIDLYVTDETSIKNFKYDASYSYNYSKRLFGNYPVAAMPQFVTNHNARLSFRYYLPGLKTYMGVSNSFTSGRPYTDPNKPGFMNSFTKPYYSLDGNLTFLLNKSLILYTSMTNLLNRKNVYGYTYSNIPAANGFYRSLPVESSRDRFFYIGLFISLNKNSAYDVSNF